MKGKVNSIVLKCLVAIAAVKISKDRKIPI